MLKLLALSDERIVAFLQAGGAQEERAIRQILKKNGPVVKQFVLKNGGTMDDAEDILYAAVTSLVFNVRDGKFNGESALGTYLFAIAKRQWYKAFSREHKQEQRERDWGQLAPSHEPYEDLSLTEDRSRFLESVLSGLREGCREVLMLWSQHYSMEEIAAHLGFKNAQVAMNKKSKCFKQLLGVVEDSPQLKSVLADLHFS
ncbi:MAG: sigma-70 family RNA polymerase sigma factor [Bacteroidota bacterium]